MILMRMDLDRNEALADPDLNQRARDLNALVAARRQLRHVAYVDVTRELLEQAGCCGRPRSARSMPSIWRLLRPERGVNGGNARYVARALGGGPGRRPVPIWEAL